MASRAEKYYIEENNSSSLPTRSSRNARLYKQVYGKYDDLNNLPIEDNTDEIDMEKLKELVLNNSTKKEPKELPEHLNILEKKKRNLDEQKLYDINQILEKAKYENNKLKETTASIPKVNKNILSTLQGNDFSIEELKKAAEQYEEQTTINTKEDQLSMTRELKYQNLAKEETKKALEEENNLSKTSDLSLDLFSDLKPTGNTITTKPIQENETTSSVKSDFHSSDTSDIDIIKQVPKGNDNDFFTSSYEFSKKDFAFDDDDFSDLKKKGSCLKIILLILAITTIVGVITYFIINYGIGIS